MLIDYSCQFHGWQTREDSAGESLNRTLLRQEPTDQAAMPGQFPTNNRGAQCDGVRVINFAQQFGSTIQVVGVREVGLQITALLARENAIGTDMDQSCTGSLAQGRQAMRQQCIDWHRLKRVVGIGQLLDQAHTVDNHIRSYRPESLDQRILTFDIHSQNDFLGQGLCEKSPGTFAPSGTENAQIGVSR
ncbi:hypothetical protein D3C84_570240 [compost metagenome]